MKSRSSRRIPKKRIVSGFGSAFIVMGTLFILPQTAGAQIRSLNMPEDMCDILREEPLDQAALAALPGVAGVEENALEHSLSILAKPGEVIFPQVNALIAERGWQVKELNVERGRLDEVFRSLTRGEVV